MSDGDSTDAADDDDDDDCEENLGKDNHDKENHYKDDHNKDDNIEDNLHKILLLIIFTESALGPLWSSSRNVYISVPFSCNLFRGLSLALRLWQDQPGS